MPSIQDYFHVSDKHEQKIGYVNLGWEDTLLDAILYHDKPENTYINADYKKIAQALLKGEFDAKDFVEFAATARESEFESLGTTVKNVLLDKKAPLQHDKLDLKAFGYYLEQAVIDETITSKANPAYADKVLADIREAAARYDVVLEPVPSLGKLQDVREGVRAAGLFPENRFKTKWTPRGMELEMGYADVNSPLPEVISTLNALAEKGVLNANVGPRPQDAPGRYDLGNSVTVVQTDDAAHIGKQFVMVSIDAFTPDAKEKLTALAADRAAAKAGTVDKGTRGETSQRSTTQAL